VNHTDAEARRARLPAGARTASPAAPPRPPRLPPNPPSSARSLPPLAFTPLFTLRVKRTSA